MKKITVVLALFLVLAMVVPSFATNGYQLIGVGQKQKSMGGAVTAAPLDAMTAITNPAGMARIGSRADFSMEAFMPARSVDFTANGGEKTSGGSKLYGVPALGWTAPAFNRNDMFFGGGMYGTSGLGVDYGQSIYMPGAALGPLCGPGGCDDVTFDGYSAIQFWKMAPTVAWNVNDQLSLGLALNLDYQSVTIRQQIRNVPFWNNPSNPAAGVTQMDVNFDLGRPTNQMGYGATVGVLFDVTDMITLGASYSTKQYFSDGEFRVGAGDIQNYNGATGAPGTYKLDLDYPMQAAVGVAVKPMDMVLVTADVKWINWSNTHNKVSLKGPTGAFGGTNGTKLNFSWEDQWVYAAGIQVSPMKQLTVRAGYNYSKAPLEEDDVFNNLIFPAIVEHHASFGVDYMFGDHWGLNVTYMKAFRNTEEGKNDVPLGFQQATPFSQNSGSEIALEEDSVGFQLTYLF